MKNGIKTGHAIWIIIIITIIMFGIILITSKEDSSNNIIGVDIYYQEPLEVIEYQSKKLKMGDIVDIQFSTDISTGFMNSPVKGVKLESFYENQISFTTKDNKRYHFNGHFLMTRSKK